MEKRKMRAQPHFPQRKVWYCEDADTVRRLVFSRQLRGELLEHVWAIGKHENTVAWVKLDLIWGYLQRQVSDKPFYLILVKNREDIRKNMTCFIEYSNRVYFLLMILLYLDMFYKIMSALRFHRCVHRSLIVLEGKPQCHFFRWNCFNMFRGISRFIN